MKCHWKLALIALLVVAAPARGEWTANVGYHNPITATYGLNLLYLGRSWGFEAGIGWLDLYSSKDSSSDTKRHTSASVVGDVNLKYFLTTGSVRPYLQGGFGAGVGASNSGAGASVGGGFAGIGVMLGSTSVYFYGSYTVDASHNNIAQGGLGVAL